MYYVSPCVISSHSWISDANLWKFIASIQDSLFHACTRCGYWDRQAILQALKILPKFCFDLWEDQREIKSVAPARKDWQLQVCHHFLSERCSLRWKQRINLELLSWPSIEHIRLQPSSFGLSNHRTSFRMKIVQMEALGSSHRTAGSTDVSRDSTLSLAHLSQGANRKLDGVSECTYLRSN